MYIKEKLVELIAGVVGNNAGADPDIGLSVPEDSQFGHYATNIAMRRASQQGKRPYELANEWAQAIATAAPAGFLKKVEAAKPGFINFWLSDAAVQETAAAVAREKHFGKGVVGVGKTAIVEYSSVNIAKPFHLGHLRNTIIGDSLANILGALGYEIVRWNYLGDWGTQFGRLIAAYQRWGDKAAIEKHPIAELQKLYVRFHEEAVLDPELEQQGQEEFKKLEAGDKENRALWEWFKKESLVEFEAMYKQLGVTFDVWIGESFFEGELKELVSDLLRRGIAEPSEGAVVIKLDEYNLPPALIEKSDGASLYLTRDIANLRYRLQKYHPEKILYVIGNEQSLAFEQLFAVAKKIGLDSAELLHIKYGLVLGESGKKFSTRRGDAIAVEEVLRKATELARSVVEEKARELSPEEKDAAASAVAIGALKYNDLKENRGTDVVFDWDAMLDFGGDSAPYLQYAHARLRSVLRKAEEAGFEIGKYFNELNADAELALMRKIFEFPDAVLRAGERYATSILANYAYKLAVAANKFYETSPIFQEDRAGVRAGRLALAALAARTIQSALTLLGIASPERI